MTLACCLQGRWKLAHKPEWLPRECHASSTADRKTDASPIWLWKHGQLQTQRPAQLGPFARWPAKHLQHPGQVPLRSMIRTEKLDSGPAHAKVGSHSEAPLSVRLADRQQQVYQVTIRQVKMPQPSVADLYLPQHPPRAYDGHIKGRVNIFRVKRSKLRRGISKPRSRRSPSAESAQDLS